MAEGILRCTLRPIDPDAGGAAALSFAAMDGPVVIGRSEDAGWRVSDPAVSRRHAVLSRRGGGVSIRDLGSRHGTTVNGSRLGEGDEIELRQGDVVGLGSWRCMVSGPRTGTMMQTIVETDVRVQRLEQHALNGLAQMKLDRLLAATRAFSGAKERDEVAEVLVGAVRGIRGCQRAHVVRQVGTGEFEVVAQSQAPGEVRLSQTLIREASDGKVAQLLAGAAPDTRSHSLIELDIQTALCAPVMALGQPESFLYIDSRGGEDRIERDTAAYCQALVGVAGLSIERIFAAEMEERRRQLDRDLRAARDAQELLFPPRAGEVSGVGYVFESIPGRHVGGDLFDIFVTERGRVAFFLGDATGKGVGAGMQMVATQTQLRTLLARGAGLAEAMSVTSESLMRRSDTGKFVTLVAGLADPASGELELCDAGHGFVFLRCGGSLAERVEVEGSVPLGVEAGTTYGTTRLMVPAGSRLILVSDGVVEQADPGGRQFGLDRVLGILAGASEPEAEVRALVEAVRGHAEGPLSDDLTAASIRL